MKSMDNCHQPKCSHTKKRRIDNFAEPESQNAIKSKNTTNLYCKVLCREDLVSIVTKSQLFLKQDTYSLWNLGDYNLGYLLLLKNAAMIKYMLPKVE